MISSLLYHSIKAAFYSFHTVSPLAGIIAFVIVGLLIKIFKPNHRSHR